MAEVRESWSEASSYSLAGRAGRLQSALSKGLEAEVGDTWGLGRLIAWSRFFSWAWLRTCC